ncbi:hypothetical protein [Schumannella sp. 10F1B-5-1]|uniref:hypothetical protein n=1 Tax=Schumannella sp. 10F1B-5-1 TaxID=2590780 RepID=UPI00113070CB|nr:hypothetical protein [Schumannella sp. 10F1B-5-1]TPW73055.1 hypothetical protein FJ658_07350 [Schumannella sp. 10F1B-5-1]
MLRLLVSLAVGALVGAVIVSIVGPPDGAGGLLIGISSTVLVISVMLMLIGRSMRGTVAPDAASLQAARDARRLGLARVDALRQTGTQINDQPYCEIDLTVQPLRGAAFATTIGQIVAVTEVPAYQPGSEHEVLLVVDGGPEVALVGDGQLSLSERGRLRIPARSSVPFRSIAPHTRIVGGRRRGPLIGVGASGRPWRLALFVVLALVAATAVVLPFREAVGQTVAAIGDGRLKPDARRPEIVRAALDAITREVGHDRVVSIGVYEDFVIVDAPIEVGGTRTDEWMYRGGQVSHRGAATSQPELAEEQFRSSDVAVERIWALLERASVDAGTPIGDASVRIARATDDDIDSPTFIQAVGDPEITFSIGDDYGDTAFIAAADGSGLRRR